MRLSCKEILLRPWFRFPDGAHALSPDHVHFEDIPEFLDALTDFYASEGPIEYDVFSTCGNPYSVKLNSTVYGNITVWMIPCADCIQDLSVIRPPYGPSSN